MKKLLAISPHLSTGGGPQVLVKRIELIKNDYEIYVIEYSNISDQFIIQKNRIKKLIDPDKFFTLGNDKNELISLIDRINPDIIHMEEIPEMFMDYNISKKLYDINRKYKIFETTHSSDFDVNKKLFFPDKFIFVSQYNCFKFNKFGIPTEVVEYPVEKQPRLLSKKEKSMSDLGMDPNFKHILNVGLFTPRKNQAHAFDIAKKLENEKILFHFVGNQADNFKHYWEPIIKNKSSNCVLWGERDDVDKFYDACDIFLFTSMGFRFDKELNPLVIKEALNAQIPLLLFPLDVYCGKYDNEPMITYLNGDVNVDAEIVKNYNKFNFDDEKTQITQIEDIPVEIIRKDDIIVRYDNEENKIKMSIDNPHDIQKTDYNVTVTDNHGSLIYNEQLGLFTNRETWIQISNKEISFVSIDFEKDGIIISKIIHLYDLKKVDIKEPMKSDKSDELFIISTYPDTDIKDYITKKCIESIKKDDRKIMISSHIPVSNEIQNMVDYYIYDGFNPLIKHTLYNNYWYQTDDFRADVLFEKLSKHNNLNQSLTVLNNIENSISIAKSLGYKKIINITYDYIFSDNDLKTINKLSNDIDINNKEGYFMQTTDNNLDTLKTVFFIIDIDLYKEVFTNPRLPEKYNRECSDMNCDNFLERYFYKKLENHKDRLLLEQTTEEKIFDGYINIFSGVEYLTYLPIENEKNTFVIWLSTNNTTDNRKVIIEQISNNIIIDTLEQDITNKSFLYKIIYLKDDEDVIIKTKIIDNANGNILMKEEFGTINTHNFNELLNERGNFKVKNSLILKDKPIKINDIKIKIGTVINYTTIDYDLIKESLESVKPISTLINIATSDYKYDGTPENMDKINKTHDKLHKDNVNFVQYEFDKNINVDEEYWKNVSRFLGVKYLKEFDWILFLNSDESILTDNFKEFVSNDLKNDAYLFSENDSPILIKKGMIPYQGNRLNIANNIKNSIINTEKEFNVKLFKKNK